MAQIINQQGNPFGRIGAGLGQGLGEGLSEQLPKELDRNRLAKGLKSFAENSAKMNPLQQLAHVSTIPGVTDQMVRSFGDLAKQQAQSEGLNNFTADPFKNTPGVNQDTQPQNENAPSITTRAPLDATLKPYIPKTMEQLNQRAAELYKGNRGFYKNDPQLAVQAAIQEDSQLQAQNQALQGQRTNEQGVQKVVQGSLQKQQEALGATVPGNVYSDIENKAINAVLPKSQGGEGLTEQEAIKKYGKELDAISRDYKAVETVGGWKLLTATPSGNKEALRSVRNKFKERDDLENLADTYIAKNNLSPGKAYYLAYPVSEIKQLNNAIKGLPTLIHEGLDVSSGYAKPNKGLTQDQIIARTLEVAEKIAPLMQKDGSPLSVGEELNSRGYDRQTWLNYLDKNRKKLDLTERQARELDKPRTNMPTSDDLWMFLFSGLDELVEK